MAELDLPQRVMSRIRRYTREFAKNALYMEDMGDFSSAVNYSFQYQWGDSRGHNFTCWFPASDNLVASLGVSTGRDGSIYFFMTCYGMSANGWTPIPMTTGGDITVSGATAKKISEAFSDEGTAKMFYDSVRSRLSALKGD